MNHLNGWRKKATTLFSTLESLHFIHILTWVYIWFYLYYKHHSFIAIYLHKWSITLVEDHTEDWNVTNSDWMLVHKQTKTYKIKKKIWFIMSFPERKLSNKNYHINACRVLNDVHHSSLIHTYRAMCNVHHLSSDSMRNNPFCVVHLNTFNVFSFNVN